MPVEIASQRTPAGRAYHLIQTALKMKPQETCIVAWTKTFEIEASEDAAFWCLGEFGGLLRDTKRTLTDIGGSDVEQLVKAIDSISKRIAETPINAQWNLIASQVKPEQVMCLALADQAIDRHGLGDPQVDFGEVDQLRHDLDSLIDRVTAGSLQADVKRLLLDILEMARQSLLSFRTEGITALTRVLDSMYGAICRNGPAIQENKATPEVSSTIQWWSKLNGLLSKACKTGRYIAEMKNVAGLLLGPASGDDAQG